MEMKMITVSYRYNGERKVQHRQFKDHAQYVGWLNEMPADDYVVVVKWEVR